MNTIEHKKRLAGQIASTICDLANIAEDWNDAQEEPDERARGNGAIGLIVFEDGSGFIADVQQGENNQDALFTVHRFANPEEAQIWFFDNISGRSLIGPWGGEEDRLYKTAETMLDYFVLVGDIQFEMRFGSLDVIDVCRQIVAEGEGNPHPWSTRNHEQSK